MASETTPTTPSPNAAPLTPMDKTTIQGSHIMSLICLGLVVLIHILAPLIWKGTFSAVAGKTMYWVIDILAVIAFIVFDIILWFQNFDNQTFMKNMGTWLIVLFIYGWIGIWNAQAKSNVDQGLPAVYEKNKTK